MLTTQLIGQRIATARKDQALSQAQLAERLCISAQAVGKWERGESLPDILMLHRLAVLLGMDVNYFTEGTPPHRETVATEPVLTPKESPHRPKWNFSKGNWTDADFSGLSHLQETFGTSNLQRCRFNESDLSGLLLNGNNIHSCDFSDANLQSCRIQRSHLECNAFTHCNLQLIECNGSYLRDCDFTDADLTGAHLKSGGFEKNQLTNATWERTVFEAMYIADVVFNGPVTDCVFEQCAFKRVVFRDAILTHTFFRNKSLKQVQFIDCQADRLTFEILKSGKADMNGIRLLPS